MFASLLVFRWNVFVCVCVYVSCSCFFFQTTADVKFTTAGLYGIYLHVFDKASNYESARRFTIFDDNPVVEVYGTAPFVPTAAVETGHQWINKPVSDIKIDFNGRYKNLNHIHLFLLAEIEMDEDIKNQLDDSDGIRTLEAIQNNDGDKF